MALVKWSTPTPLSISGIGNLDTVNNEVSDAMNNETLLYRRIALHLNWTCTIASNADEVIEVYLLYALDGVTFEDGSGPTDPKKSPSGIFVDNGSTGVQRQSISMEILPFMFKILLNSELSQTAQALTLIGEGFGEEVV